MRLFAIVLTLALLGPSCCMKCAHPTQNPTKYIRDAAGRSVVYHGANVSNSAKHCVQGRAGVTWEGTAEFSKAWADGYNAARYLVFWEALEPVEGVFDTAYLTASVAKVKEITACSLDVIIDLHQDLYAQKFGGDGFPTWMVQDSGKAFKPHPENWALNYLEPAVLACFNYLWNNPEPQAKYARALKAFVAAFDTIPGVVGYDIINEPFPGTALPNEFEKGKLTKFYERMLAAVRETSGKLVLFEPWMSTSAGIPTYLAFKPDSLCVYAPHYYSLICESHGTYNPAWDTKAVRCALKMKADEARYFGTPMLLGEFGISTKSNRFYGYLMDLADMADQYGFGWTYWSYDKQQDGEFGLLNDDGSFSQQEIALRRAYPQRIAGDNPVWWFNGKKFQLEYDSKALRAPTVVFVPPEAKNVTVSVDGKAVEHDPVGRTFVWPDTVAGHRKIEITTN